MRSLPLASPLLRRRAVAATALLIVCGVASAAPALPVPTTLEDFAVSGTQPGDVPAGALQPSSTCAPCHGGYDPATAPQASWSGSLMALAGRDPLFFAQLTTANQDVANVGAFCLRCHVPMSVVSGHVVPPDGSALDPGDTDGITCHVCHAMVDPIYEPGVSPPQDAAVLGSLAAVPQEYGNGMFVLDSSGTRRGPYDAPLAAHGWIRSPFHRRSELCGTCHDVGNLQVSRLLDGTYRYNALDARTPSEDPWLQFPLERTYTEWNLSAFADGGVDMGGRFGGAGSAVVSTCQDCHMPVTAGFGCAFGEERADLARHDFAGAAAQVLDLIAQQSEGDPAVDQAAIARGRAEAVAMLERAASLELAQRGATLDVRLVNETGHKLPTGHIEGRRVWLNVRFLDAGGQLVGEHGHYDDAEAELDAASTAVYEMVVGLSAEAAAATGLPAGATTHMALADTIEKDNRIPPRGFANLAFETAGAPVVAWSYADGQHWDDRTFAIPGGAVSAVVTAYYQSTPRHYVEALRDGNVTDQRGVTLHALWTATGRGAPIPMVTRTLALAAPCASEDPGACDDGDACNGAETCDPVALLCRPGSPLACDDDDPCNGLETCEPASGLCRAGTPLVCDDADPCTDDVCDPVFGCLWADNHAACDDGVACTSPDVCRGGTCFGGDPLPGCAACEAVVTLPPEGGTFTATTAGAGTLTGSCGSGASSPERVYRWVAPSTGVAVIDTCGGSATFDTVVYLRAAACDGGEVACNDDTAGCATAEPNDHHGSRIMPAVTAGTAYYIVVDGYGGAAGGFTLTVTPPGTCGNGERDGAEECDGGDVARCLGGACADTCHCLPPAGGLPDLAVVVRDLHVQLGSSVAAADVAEGCASATTDVDILRFATETRNVGTADMALGQPLCPSPCSAYPGEVCGNPQYTCGPPGGYDRPHYANYARYELLDQDGRLVAAGNKQGWCLRDDPGSCPAATYTCADQGISAGCSDMYSATAGCQYVEVTAVASGDYLLQVRVDPFDRIAELDETNNVVQLPVTIARPTVPATATAAPTATVTPPALATATATRTASATPTVAPTASATSTVAPTVAPTASATPTVAPTASATPTVAPSATSSTSPTPTSSASATPTPTATPPIVPTVTASPTAVPSGTATVSPPVPTPAAGCAPTPVAGCRPPVQGRRSRLALAAPDRLRWTWRGGPPTTKDDFGTPTTVTDYRLCLYDADARVVAEAAIPSAGECGRARPRPCWKERPWGFTYADHRRGADGIVRLDLTAGSRASAARIRLTGRDAVLRQVTFPMAQPVTVQLLNAASGVCWEAVYHAPAAVNRGGRAGAFADRAD